MITNGWWNSQAAACRILGRLDPWFKPAAIFRRHDLERSIGTGAVSGHLFKPSLSRSSRAAKTTFLF